MADKFDGWIRVKALGEGGQAWTYLAHNESDEKLTPYVLKVLKHKSNPARLKRFAREIEAGARLFHPNVVRIETENIEAPNPYVVMEFCAGGELQRLDLSQFSLVGRLRLFEQICAGVAHMHENRVIHRDLKPNNIFLREDKKTPVVGDLGLCLITEQDERLTETTEAVGGRLYMAPELEDGRYEDAKPAADVYSLGKLLYWLVSNKRSFSREKHRNEKYDLTKSDPTAGMAFVYNLLDGSITSTPESRRYKDASALLTAAERTSRRIINMGHAIDPSISQKCMYCHEGNYQKLLEGTPQDRDFEWKAYALGIQIRNVSGFTGHRWLIMACDYCGNLQWFRVDLAVKNPQAWQEGSIP